MTGSAPTRSISPALLHSSVRETRGRSRASRRDQIEKRSRWLFMLSREEGAAYGGCRGSFLSVPRVSGAGEGLVSCRRDRERVREKEREIKRPATQLYS